MSSLLIWVLFEISLAYDIVKSLLLTSSFSSGFVKSNLFSSFTTCVGLESFTRVAGSLGEILKFFYLGIRRSFPSY